MTDDDLKGMFDALREENATAHTETRRDLHETADRLENRFDVSVERLEKRFDLLAESVQMISETVDRRIGSVEEAIARTAAETQAMIKSLMTSSIAASVLLKNQSARSN